MATITVPSSLGLQSLNFTSDCQATDSAWDLYFATGSPSFGQWHNAWPILLSPAVPLEYANASNASLILLGDNLIKSVDFNQTLAKAAQSCRSQFCHSLDFTGNADIAGVGAIAAYGTIAALTTILVIICSYISDQDEKDKINITKLNQHGSRMFKALVSVSISFSETIAYLTIMSSIAGISFSRTAHTVYEKSLCVLVAFLACSANSLCTVMCLAYYGRDAAGRIPWGIQLVGLISCLSLTIPTILEVQNPSMNLIDVYCYGEANLPYRFMTISSWIQVSYYSILTSIIIWSIVSNAFGNPSPRAKENMTKVGIGFAVIIYFLELIMMWTNFGFVIVIRKQAKSFFGASYADNAFGYGQIMAAGFCLQAVVQFVTLSIIGPESEKESPASSETNQAAPASRPISPSQANDDDATSLQDLPSRDDDEPSSSHAQRTNTVLLEEGTLAPTPRRSHDADARSAISVTSTTELLPASRLTNRDTADTQSVSRTDSAGRIGFGGLIRRATAPKGGSPGGSQGGSGA